MKTELDKILTISGKGGLFKVLSRGKSAVIVESLTDSKRQPLSTNDKVSALSDITMFTVEDDMPLREIFLKAKEQYDGGPGPDPKADGNELRKAMSKVLPEYDADRVYASDIKKFFTWY
ncbi:MAG: DUF5606 domain-containing protein, partial [Flavobacteriales bacterium]